MGIPLTAAERKSHADQLFNAKHYAEAGQEYHSIEANDPSLSVADQKRAEDLHGCVRLQAEAHRSREVERLPGASDDTPR